jgi:hypothetical protein
MPTSVLFRISYVEARGKWSAEETSSSGGDGPVQQVEITIWTVLSLTVLFLVASLFVTHVHMNLDTAVILTYLYSIVCLLLSNEYLLSDWHSK